MSTRAAVLLAFALVLIASVFATPVPAVHDLHATSLDLYALEDDNRAAAGYFAVRVERTDKIVDLDAEQEEALARNPNSQDVDGTLLAARVSDIIVMFEVSPQGTVSIDGKAVPLGMSNVRVEADVQTGVTAQGEKLDRDELVGAWDRGLVGMRVFVESATSDDGVVHLTISEMITEINGKDVVQRNALQQLVDVNLDGTLTYRKPCPVSAETAQRMAEGDESHRPHGHHGHGRKACMGRKISAWLRSLSAPTKIFFATLLGMTLGVLASAVTRVFLYVFRQPAATVAVIYDDENSPFIAKVNMEEADEKLPIYTSDGYTKVATDEKK